MTTQPFNPDVGRTGAAGRFLVAGEALFDVFVGADRDGATFMEARAGGSPFNVAIGLARLGQEVTFLGGISSDPLGDRLVDHLTREGVNVSLVGRPAKRTTLSLVALSVDGVPTYSFYGAGSADAALDPGRLPATPPSVTAIHVGSFATVIQPVGSAIAALVERETGRLISYDPNVRPTIEPNLDIWRATIRRFATQVHLLKISAEDFALLYPGEDPERLAADWLDLGVHLVVLTEGARGARAWTRSHTTRIVAPPVAVVDTIGAGDSFQAALLTALARHGLLDRDAIAGIDPATLDAALAFASRAAGITCGRRGADLPRAAEL